MTYSCSHTQGVRPHVEGKQRTPLSFRVATGTSWIMDYSLPGSSVHGILQTRVLEWGAIAFSHLGHKVAPRGARRDSKGKRSPLLPFDMRPDSLGESGMQT